jgi:hypothetical protein
VTLFFIHDHSEGLRPSDSLTRSLAGPQDPRSARVGSLARSFADAPIVVLKPALKTLLPDECT